MWVGGYRQAPAALPPAMTWYPFYRRLGGPQGQSGRVQKTLPPPGFYLRTVQPIASRYIDWAITAYNKGMTVHKAQWHWLAQVCNVGKAAGREA